MINYLFLDFFVTVILWIPLPQNQYEIVQLVAFVFGTFWMIINFYTMLPIFQLITEWMNKKIFGEKSTVDELMVDVEKTDKIENLPTIDILLPAYKEGNVIKNSIKSIHEANYPNKLLNINILVEPEDSNTKSALSYLQDKYDFIIHEIPFEYPSEQNKPRALNYGFEKTDGDIVGIIDAEDIVDPDLFKHVLAGLIIEDRDFVQGRLDMINESDGWKNLMFRAEYSYWFNILLAGFHSAGYPVPLGGTTNFFKRKVLEEISEIRKKLYKNSPKDSCDWFSKNGLKELSPWDPRNVTEDFELGLLLWMEGYKIGYMNVTTKEESPLDYTNWITQRTRWEKGKVYSLFQWLRYPPKGVYAKFHLYMQSFLPHYGPINLIGIVVLLLYSNYIGFRLGDINLVILLTGGAFTVGYCLMHGIAYWQQTSINKASRLARSALVSITLPLYWVLLWGADNRALYQIYRGVLNWEKTEHHGRNKDK